MNINYATIIYDGDLVDLHTALQALEQIHKRHAVDCVQTCINCPCVPEDPACFCTYNIVKDLVKQAKKYKITERKQNGT